MIKMRMPASRETIGWRCAIPRVMLRALLKHDLRKAADFADHIMRRNKPTSEIAIRDQTILLRMSAPMARKTPFIRGWSHGTTTGTLRNCTVSDRGCHPGAAGGAAVKAESLFDTLDMRQKPDGLRILDQVKRQLFVWVPDAHDA